MTIFGRWLLRVGRQVQNADPQLTRFWLSFDRSWVLLYKNDIMRHVYTYRVP
jgi:hypothetical protein